MSIFSKTKKASVRKFLGNTAKYVSWQTDVDGDCRLAIHDGRSVVNFHECMHTGMDKDLEVFDKTLGILVDEINAFRKAVKTIKGGK